MKHRATGQCERTWTETHKTSVTHTDHSFVCRAERNVGKALVGSRIPYKLPVTYKGYLSSFAVCAHGWRFGLGGVLELARASPRGRLLHGTPLWAPRDHFEPTGLRQWNMRRQTPMSRSSHRLTRAARLSPHLHVGAEPAPSRLVGLCQGPIRLGRVLGWHTTSVHGDLGAKEQYRSRPANMHQKHV